MNFLKGGHELSSKLVKTQFVEHPQLHKVCKYIMKLPGELLYFYCPIRVNQTMPTEGSQMKRLFRELITNYSEFQIVNMEVISVRQC